jgi:hypothetical protein
MLSTDEKKASTDLSVAEILRFARNAFSYLLRRWWIIAIIAILGGVIGFTVAWMTPKKYSSNLTFILEESKGGGGGLSALTSELGLDIGLGGGSSNMLFGENIMGLLKSKKFIKEVLLTPVDSGNYSLADRYADVNKFRNDWKKSAIGDVRFPASSEDLNRIQDSLLHIIQDRIILKELSVTRPEKRMSFFKVNLLSTDELISKLFTERLVKKTVDFYIESKTRRLRTNVDRLQRRADSIAMLLNNTTYRAASAQSRALDINPAYQTATVQVELNIRDKVLLGTIYGELVKNLEIQKVLLSQETPVVEVIDGAELPLQAEKTSKTLYFILGCLLFGFLAAGILIVKKYLYSNTRTVHTIHK